MDAQTIFAFLDENWDALRGELGPAWEDFVRAYRDVAGRLPPLPNPEDLERAADALLAELTKHEYVRGFLAGFLFAIRRHELPFSRLLLDPATTLADRRLVELIVNRMRTRIEELEAEASTKVPDSN